MRRTVPVGACVADLSSDGSVQLEPPCTVVVQSGASIAVSLAAKACGGGEVEVFERNGVACVVGLEGADVVVAEAAERSTSLSELLQPGMGTCHWAACVNVR